MNIAHAAIAYPLKVSGSLDPKPWGGSRLSLLGKTLPDEPIGESLESGPDSRVMNGRLAGATLAALAQTHRARLLGRRGLAASGPLEDFPLLIKFIDAHDNLSVQVHPDDDGAPTGKRGKTEAWVILHADPGASIVTGIDGPLDIDRVSDQILWDGVSAGDVFFIPAGTIHAIGAGVLLYEVQQASDVTYRLYDWGRKRVMHIADGKRATNTTQRVSRVMSLRIDEGREMLVACRHFALERWTITDRSELPDNPDAFRVLTILEGTLSIAGVAANAGDTLVLPADLPACSVEGAATSLLAYIPDLAVDVVKPLLAAGHDVSAIRALGNIS